jgi:predicted CoA-binding protein
VDVASLYVPPHIGLAVVEELATKGVRTVYVNPGAESDELLAKMAELGLEAIQACSILALGVSPATVQ